MTLPGGPVIWVVGTASSGERVVQEQLPHGVDPAVLMRRSGWAVVGARSVVGQSDPHEITLTFDVAPAPTAVERHGPVSRDRGLVVSDGEAPVVVQRLAVYAVVHSARGLLLTENSDLTNAAGTWALPGGGIDPGELPEDALHREVWEETGQRVRIEGLATVASRHWVGRAPTGRLEDFHAVRIVYRAVCDEPSDPVVHDVGGTTAAAGWFGPEALHSLRLGTVAAELIPRFTGDGG